MTCEKDKKSIIMFDTVMRNVKALFFYSIGIPVI